MAALLASGVEDKLHGRHLASKAESAFALFLGKKKPLQCRGENVDYQEWGCSLLNQIGKDGESSTAMQNN